MPLKIIIIEDDPDIREMLVLNLKQRGYESGQSRDGSAGLQLVRQVQPALVLLDLELPGMHGLEVCRSLKADPATQGIPIIIVTVKGQEGDIVKGLELGADDYVTKPFNINELFARIKSVLRRTAETTQGGDDEVIVQGGLTINAAKHEVAVDGQLVEMTPTEFGMLHLLASQPGRVFTKEQLKLHAIGDDVTVLDHNVEVHIGAVRKKLGGQRELIETVWGVCYRFRDG